MHSYEANAIRADLRGFAHTTSNEIPTGLTRASADMLQRLRESMILADPQILDLGRNWTLYGGLHRAELRRRLSQIGTPPSDDEELEELLSAVECMASRSNNPDSVTKHDEVLVFETYSDRRGHDLRCECCGYHFRTADLSKFRLGVASDAGLRFAQSVDPRRVGDRFKPLSRQDKDRKFLRLEIDHIRPMTAFGRSTAENLQVLCRLCNEGKSNFYLPLEALSTVASGALSIAFMFGDANAPLPATVAALRLSDGICSLTGRTSTETELTVRFSRSEAKWHVPWELAVVAYDAIGGDQSLHLPSSDLQH